MSDVKLPVTYTLLWCMLVWVTHTVCEVLIPSNDLNQNSTSLPNANTESEALLDLNDGAPLKSPTEPTTNKLHSTNTASFPTWSTQISLSSDAQDEMTSPVVALNVTTETPWIQFQTDSSLTWNTIRHDQDTTNISNVNLTTATTLKSPGARPLSDEENLMDILFHKAGYNPSARPVINSSKTASVQMQFSLLHIKDLDVRSQILTTTGLLILIWRDERLTWRPKHHNKMKDIILEAKELWRPEFAVINGAETILDKDYNDFRAVIQHDGIVHWEPGGVFKTMCTIDITYYPFDVQACSLTFGAWSYHTSKMNLTNMEDTVNMDSYKENGEWDIIATEVKRNEFAYACCPDEKYSNVNFKIILRRRHTFYILNVILPSIMTSVLLLSIFFCTPAQKVQIGVVVLLSFRLFLINVSGEIPKTSDHIPLLGIYLTCTMAITTLSMVLTVFVLNLHHISDRPVPRWAKKVIFVYLARALGMCSMVRKTSDIVTSDEIPKSDRRRHTISNNGGFFRRSYTGLENNLDETSAIIEMQNRPHHGDSLLSSNDASSNIITTEESPWVLRNSHGQSSYPHNSRQNQAYDFDNTPGQYPQYTPDNKRCPSHNMANTPIRVAPMSCGNYNNSIVEDDNLRKKAIKEKEKEETEKNAKDWKRVAEICDRLFFWLFLLAILTTTLILFHPLTKSYIAQHQRSEHS